jgi:hypothetical protein
VSGKCGEIDAPFKKRACWSIFYPHTTCPHLRTIYRAFNPGHVESISVLENKQRHASGMMSSICHVETPDVSGLSSSAAGTTTVFRRLFKEFSKLPGICT